jgi:hypothetical protein
MVHARGRAVRIYRVENDESLRHVQRSLDDRREMMDSCRTGALWRAGGV